MLRSRPSTACFITVLGALLFGACVSGADSPSQETRNLIPWKSLDDKTRAKLEHVVNSPTVYHRSPTEVFACNPDLYLLLLNEPVLTLELWKALGASDAELEEVGPGQFRGSDGHFSTGQWEFVYRSPELNVMYAEGQYRGPLLGSTLETKSVLVLRTMYFQEKDGRSFVKHRLDGFVRADAGSLKAVAKALRPVFEKSVASTMQESLWFVSLMTRYTLYDPHTVSEALDQSEKVPESVRTRMQQLLAPLIASTPVRRDETKSDER